MLTFKGIYFRFILIENGGSKQLQCPFGVQGRFTREARRADLMGWDGWDGWMDGMGWDGISKVSFNIFHTLWVDGWDGWMDGMVIIGPM